MKTARSGGALGGLVFRRVSCGVWCRAVVTRCLCTKRSADVSAGLSLLLLSNSSLLCWLLALSIDYMTGQLHDCMTAQLECAGSKS